MSKTKAQADFHRLRELAEGDGYMITSDQKRAILRILDYEKTLDMLAWYMGARQVNQEEAAMASKAVLSEFEEADA